ncbi:MAG: hypothetical protein AABY00_02120 [Nanoarchaeota archaeon]
MDKEQNNVVIISPCSLIVHGLTHILDGREPKAYNVIGNTNTPSGAFEVLRQQRPHVALIDLATGDCDPNFSFVSEMRERDLSLPLVTFSHSRNPGYNDLARLAGAQEHLSYACTPTLLHQALRRAREHSFAGVQTELGGFALNLPVPSKQVVEPHERLHLTPRQYELYVLLGEGKDAQEIAASLKIELKSIGPYCALLAQKLGHQGIPQLRYHAIRDVVREELARETKSEFLEKVL